MTYFELFLTLETMLIDNEIDPFAEVDFEKLSKGDSDK